jgi:hypothetical protein
MRRTGFVARLAIVLALVGVAACSAAPPAEGPAVVVRTALDKIAAKDIPGLQTLTCAGQADLARQQLGLVNRLGSAGALLPGLDATALVDAVKLDVSKLKVGDGTVTGDVAAVPVTGSMGVTFDATAMRPILRKVLGAQGSTMTDAQLDALVKGLAAYGQSVPLNQSIRLVRESGAWKICQENVTPVAS